MHARHQPPITPALTQTSILLAVQKRVSTRILLVLTRGHQRGEAVQVQQNTLAEIRVVEVGGGQSEQAVAFDLNDVP